jgi:predicted HTH domain antitoxin
MKTLTLQIPDSLDEKEAKTLLAAKLYEKGDLSLGQAAELLANYDVSVFNYTEAELTKEILDAQGYHL